MSKLEIQERIGLNVNRKRDTEDNLPLTGEFRVEHYRDGKKINTYNFNNGITIEGKNFLLDVMFHGTAAAGTWYLGLIDLVGYTALDETDTYDDIDQAGNGWDEFQGYTDANNGDSAVTRPAYAEDAASAKAITNSTTSIYDITSNDTVKGIFVVGLGAAADTKGDHAADGKLWSTALFTSGDVAVVIGDQLKITYTVSC